MDKKQPNTPYNTGLLMKQLWAHLARDFRSTLDQPSFVREEETLLFTNLAEFRNHDWKRGFLTPYYYFKARYQMEALFKRFCFSDDPFTDKELQSRTVAKFLETQERIGTARELPYRAFLVVQRARHLIKDILGAYDPEEHWNNCRFGKRASVGNPARESYLDLKVGTALTGSLDHIEWFDSRLHGMSDPLLSSCLSSCVPMAYPRYILSDVLSLTCVPKTWKSLRSIMPNTTLGGFYSYGLGRVLQKRLAACGLDITRRQEFHRELVKEHSETRVCVTADLSAASDSFTPQLVNMLVPRKWYRLLKLGRIASFSTPEHKDRSHLVSFCTMGIGFTFQLQTLLFYGLLKAMKDLLGISGLISVYGDDLVYPRRMHHIVTQVFTDLGFLLNMDKTYVKESFRESCGADCYCGHDVRPFSPEGRSQDLGKKEYLAFLYKTVNGLARRWFKEEIPQTMRFLYAEILRISDELFQVPLDFPDYSGIKVPWIQSDPLLPWAKVRRNYRNTGDYGFPYLAMPRTNHAVTWVFPFYWDKLRQMENGSDPVDFAAEFDSEPNLRWKRVASRPYRTPLGNRFNYRLHPTVAMKLESPRFASKTGLTITWDPQNSSATM